MVEREGKIQGRVLDNFIRDTEEILEWFARQRKFHFYASSLLYIRGEEKEPETKVKFIDFAHVLDAHDEEDRSKDYLDVMEGIENILKVWNKLKT